VNKKLLIVAALLSSSSSISFARPVEFVSPVEDESEDGSEVCALSNKKVEDAAEILKKAQRAEKLAGAELKRCQAAKETPERIRDAQQAYKHAQYDTVRAKAGLEKERTMAQHDCQPE
jgi:hypothetical protein